MKYLHTMVRVTDIEESLRFYRDALGLAEISRKDFPQGRFTLVFLAAPGDESAQVELTHNWDPEKYSGGRNFGHLAYAVDDIYAACRRLMEHGVTINRPPRDGHMAFVRSPDRVSVELLQKGAALAPAAALGRHAQQRGVVASEHFRRIRRLDFNRGPRRYVLAGDHFIVSLARPDHGIDAGVSDRS